MFKFRIGISDGQGQLRRGNFPVALVEQSGKYVERPPMPALAEEAIYWNTFYGCVAADTRVQRAVPARQIGKPSGCGTFTVWVSAART